MQLKNNSLCISGCDNAQEEQNRRKKMPVLNWNDRFVESIFEIRKVRLDCPVEKYPIKIDGAEFLSRIHAYYRRFEFLLIFPVPVFGIILGDC